MKKAPVFQRILNFIKYNNAISIGFALLFLSVSGALAASPDVREGVADAFIDVQQSVVSIDNSYIVGVDLNSYKPRIEITFVEEDNDFYYVSYTLITIDLEDGVWQNVRIEDSIQVSKEVLGERDLGLYVEEELSEIVDYKIAILKETQEYERGFGQTQKVVATAYGGLIGQFLDSKRETFLSYDPVIKEPVVIASTPSNDEPSVQTTQQETTQTSSSSSSSGGGDTPSDTTTDTTTTTTADTDTGTTTDTTSTSTDTTTDDTTGTSTDTTTDDATSTSTDTTTTDDITSTSTDPTTNSDLTTDPEPTTDTDSTTDPDPTTDPPLEEDPPPPAE